MLTRLKVSGFKNLVDVDVRFGPFTCIAGANGVGKSNLFDAIQFLSLLADHPLLDAAGAIREGEQKRTGDVRSLFCRRGDRHETEMSFEAEMIIPAEAIDDFGQKAKASITFLRYSLTIAYNSDPQSSPAGPLQIRKEALDPIPLGSASSCLLFPNKASQWRKSAVKGRRSVKNPFISTDKDADKYVVKLHQDGGGRGRPVYQASELPRTLLSRASAAEGRTALVARREMQAWRLLQLEPSALRQPDEFAAFRQSVSLDLNGRHLPATLYRLAHQQGQGRDENDPERVYAQIANRLCELIDDVRKVEVERDEKRELFTLYATGKDRTPHAAKSLSDGTLRFLALTVLAQETERNEVLCLEEPENGIHPGRIPAVLRLLHDIVTDVDEPLGPDNPLRQVIINTHSPAVVQQVPDGSVLVAELREMDPDSIGFRSACFSCLPKTWRDSDKARESGPVHVCQKGDLLAYLNPVLRAISGEARKNESRRVIDREDLQRYIAWGKGSE